MSETQAPAGIDDRRQQAQEAAVGNRTSQARLANLDRLYHVPIFALQELLSNASGQSYAGLQQAELVAEADEILAIHERDVEALYENYRYGPGLSFYLYLLPGKLAQPDRKELQRTLDELAVLERPEASDHQSARGDYESEKVPNEVILMDEEQINGIREIRYRYHIEHHFLNSEEQPDRVFQIRYGFLWLDMAVSYLTILSRDEEINSLLTRALSSCLQAIPVPVRLPKELVDKHFSIENIRRLSHYDPGTGVRQSLSGRGLWKAFDEEIATRERRYARPFSLYVEEVADGVRSGLGVTASKGKISLTKTLPTSLLRDWAIQRLPDLVRDVKNMRNERPEEFSRSLEMINRMRLPAPGKAAIIEIVEALLRCERDEMTTVELSQSALELYTALAGKYFNPYLRIPCSQCEEMAELCPKCESPDLDLDDKRITCKNCGAQISDGDMVTLHCMDGHSTRAPLSAAFGITPNHWLQKRMVRIFGEVGQVWVERIDYFHIEGKILYRLQKGETDRNELPGVVQNYISNFWGPVAGKIHSGRGDIAGDDSEPEVEAPAEPGQTPTVGYTTSGLLERYENLDLRLRGNMKAGYTVEASVSDGGSVPPQPLSLPRDNAFGLQLVSILRQETDEHEMKVVGKALFDALFPTPILKLWARAAGSLEEQNGLRIRLHIEPPELSVLPWELLFDEEYVALRLRYPIVRYLDLADPPRPLVVRLPLRLLVSVARPTDKRQFDVGVELDRIQQALQPLGNRIQMEILEHTTCDGLLARLRQGYHLLHYLGHGTFDGDEGFLLLEDADGKSDPTPASMLGQIVGDSNLRLVVLSACQTPVAGRRNAFGGVAQQMVRGGMPAVVAMQLAIADRTAVAFHREFYGALAEGWPVDAAVQQGRRGIMTELGQDWTGQIDWAVPTLHMCTPDGVILGILHARQASRRLGPGRDGTSLHHVQYHGPVYGAAHAGNGDIYGNTFQLGMDAEDVEGLFEVLRQQVDEQAPPDKKEIAQQQVDELEDAIERKKPDVGKIESVQNWFKEHLPQLAGAVTSLILNPLVGRIVEAAGEIVTQEFKRRFGIKK
jgi:hypothetical protein